MVVFDAVQFVTAVALMAVILLQQRSAGMGVTFGGGMDGSFYTRRGFEKFLTQATVVLAAAFIAISFARILL